MYAYVSGQGWICISRIIRSTQNLKKQFTSNSDIPCPTSVPLLPWEQQSGAQSTLWSSPYSFPTCFLICLNDHICCTVCALHTCAALLWSYLSVPMSTLQIVYPTNILTSLQSPENFMPFYMQRIGPHSPGESLPLDSQQIIVES